MNIHKAHADLIDNSYMKQLIIRETFVYLGIT